jgi:membrane peptidoglycan carboxypeptidase
LSESVNVTAVRTLMDVGANNMRETSHRLGITDLREDNCGPTITLGSCGVKLLDMTYAYSTIANNGTMRGKPTVENLPGGFRDLDPISVVEIKDASGDTLYQQENQEEQVVDPAYAYMITHILSNQAITWSGLRIDRPAATKTGTSEEFKDSLVIGYTPDITVGVWMGNADGTAMAPETFSSVGAGPMWRTFMQEAVEYLGVSSKQFEVPSNIETAMCAGVQEVFVEGEQPTQPGTCRAPGASTPSPTPNGSPTPSPSATPAPSQTASPTPSATVRPTQSGTPRTPTPVPTSSATPVPTATATPVPSGTSPPASNAPNIDPEDEDD